jgi:hypothetical protein
MNIRTKDVPLALFPFLVLLTSTWVLAQEPAGNGPSQPKTAPAEAVPAQPPAAQPAQAVVPATTPTAEDLKSVEEAYSLKLKGLEEKVNDLKEKVFKSKARLMLLQETVLTGKIAGAKAHLVFRNDMGRVFKLESVSFSLDGAPIFSKVDINGDLASQKEFDVLPKSSIAPGNHNISAFLVYRGSGGFFFSYVDGYRFKIRSSQSFVAEEGKVTTIKVVGFEKGGLTTDLMQRPSLRFDVDMKSEVPEPKQAGNPDSNNASRN